MDITWWQGTNVMNRCYMYALVFSDYREEMKKKMWTVLWWNLLLCLLVLWRVSIQEGSFFFISFLARQLNIFRTSRCQCIDRDRHTDIVMFWTVYTSPLCTVLINYRGELWEYTVEYCSHHPQGSILWVHRLELCKSDTEDAELMAFD